MLYSFPLLVVFDISCHKNSPSWSVVRFRPCTNVKPEFRQKNVCYFSKECGSCLLLALRKHISSLIIFATVLFTDFRTGPPMDRQFSRVVCSKAASDQGWKCGRGVSDGSCSLECWSVHSGRTQIWRLEENSGVESEVTTIWSSIYLEEFKTGSQRDTCTPTFIATLPT